MHGREVINTSYSIEHLPSKSSPCAKNIKCMVSVNPYNFKGLVLLAGLFSEGGTEARKARVPCSSSPMK